MTGRPARSLVTDLDPERGSMTVEVAFLLVLLVVPLFYRLRVSPVLGFIIVGMAVGPSGFGSLAGDVPWLSAFTITDASAIGPVAELGVVMLLFMIGLELSLERLLLLRRLVFGLGSAQGVL